jgi:hypothetical protein
LGYDDIRAALRRDFSVDSLNEITRIGHEMLSSDAPLRHPSAALALASIAQKIAWHWEGNPVMHEAAASVEVHLKPRFEAVVAAAGADSSELIDALDDLARAYADALPLLSSQDG